MSAPLRPQRFCLTHAVDSDHEAEVPGPARLDAGQRVLEDRRLRGCDAEQLGAAQERVGGGLARDVLVAAA